MCWLLNRWPPLPPPSKCRPYAAPTPPHTLQRDSRLERDSTLFSSGNAVRRSISLKEDAVLSSPCPPAPINLFVWFGFFLSHLRVRLGPFIADSQSTPSPATVDMKLAAGSVLLLLPLLLLAVSLAPASSAFSDESLKDLSRLPHLQRHWLQRLEQVNKRNKVTTPEPLPVTDAVAAESLEVLS